MGQDWWQETNERIPRREMKGTHTKEEAVEIKKRDWISEIRKEVDLSETSD